MTTTVTIDSDIELKTADGRKEFYVEFEAEVEYAEDFSAWPGKSGMEWHVEDITFTRFIVDVITHPVESEAEALNLFDALNIGGAEQKRFMDQVYELASNGLEAKLWEADV